MGEVVALRNKRLPQKLSTVVVNDKIISSLVVGERVFDARVDGPH